MGLQFCRQRLHAVEGENHDEPRDVRPMCRSRPETELEDEETEDGDGTVAVAGVLGTEKTYINVLRR